jgi:hypothetical protein
LISCAFGEVADGALDDAILEVGVHAAEGELLVRVMACLFEGVVGESPIVAVVVVDFDAMFGSKGLKGAFGSDGFDQQVIDLGVHVSEATEVVNEDSCAAIALLGEFSF